MAARKPGRPKRPADPPAPAKRRPFPLKVKEDAVFALADEGDRAAESPVALGDTLRAGLEAVKADLLRELPQLIQKTVTDHVPRDASGRSPIDARALLRHRLESHLHEIAARPSPLHDDNRALANELAARTLGEGLAAGLAAGEVYDEIAEGMLTALAGAVRGEPARPATGPDTGLIDETYDVVRAVLAGAAAAAPPPPAGGGEAPPEPVIQVSPQGTTAPPVTLALARTHRAAVGRFLAVYRTTASQNPEQGEPFRLLAVAGRTPEETAAMLRRDGPQVEKDLRTFHEQYNWNRREHPVPT
jgi:hypothetical protein